MAAPICQLDAGGDRSGHLGDLIFTDAVSAAPAAPVVAEIDESGQPTGVLRANGVQITESGDVVAAGGRSVKLLSHLRAIRGLYDGEAVHVASHDNSASYYTRFPAGGGVFVWDAPSTNLDDNATTINAGGVGRWKRVLVGGTVTPEMFGAVGNANWMEEDPASPNFGTWYQDQAKTIPAANDSAALQAAFDFAGSRTYRSALVWLSRWYLVEETVAPPDTVSVKGTGVVQSGNRTGAALCAGRSVTSVRQANNTWSNPVIRFNNRLSLAGSGDIGGFSVLGCSTVFGSTYSQLCWSSRCGIQFHYAINPTLENMTVIGFQKAGVSFVSSQDISPRSLSIFYCGTDDGENWHPAMEFLRDPVDTTITGANALHFTGLRIEACKAYLNFDNGTSQRGEIHFTGSKLESPSGWRFQSSPIRVVSGFGPIVFGSGLNVRFPTCRTEGGTQIYVFQIANYATKFDGCKLIGGSQWIRATSINGVDIDDVVIQEANPALTAVWCSFRARVSGLRVLHSFADNSARNAVRFGSGAVVRGLHFGQLNDPEVAQTSGALVYLDAIDSAPDGNVISGITVAGNHEAALSNYAALVSGPSGAANANRHNIVRREAPVIAGYSMLSGGALDAAGCSEIFLDGITTAATISSIKNGFIGQRLALTATASSGSNVTLQHGSSVVLTGAANVVLSSAVVVELMCIDGAVWRQI